ncbi:MAG: TolC family protein [Balneolaceae bacterium]|nr:TolC family protein [Balneolaceae bacterium]
MRHVIAVLILCTGLTFQLDAQNTQASSDSVQITLQEAIDIALENNFQLKVAENNLALSEFNEKSEKADFFPSLSANFSASQSTGPGFVPGSSRFINQTSRGISGGLSSSLPLFNGFENINSLRSSQYDTRSQEENKQRVRESIIFNTASSFLQVVLNRELLQIARETLEASEKTLEQVQAQVDVGSRPTVDLYNQEATVASNELQVTNQENALNISRLQLIRQLQVDPLNSYDFVIPEINVEDMTPTDYNLEQLVATALENRSDLKSEKYSIESIEYQLKATKASLYPSLSLNANLSTDYSDQSTFPGTDDQIPFNDQFFDQNIRRSFSLSLQIPIFNNLNIRNSVQAQEINYDNARLQLEDTRLQVVQEVNQAYNDYVAVVKRLESTEKALRAARRSYETQQERYNVGAGTLIELSDANSQFVEARSNRAQAELNFIFQQKLLDYYLGLLNEDIQLINN